MMMLMMILGGALVARMVLRARFRRAWAHGAYGHGCGGPFGRFGRFGRSWEPIDLSAPDRFEELPRLGRRSWRWQPWQRSGAVSRPAVDVPAVLELNERQRELYDQVIAKAKRQVPAAALAEALIAVGREPFGRDAIELLVGPSELADDFEQLHHSLTSEQRAKLREVTTA